MPIEYNARGEGIWYAKVQGFPVCRILAVKANEVMYFKAMDLVNRPAEQIPGSPFESLNKAKAVIEYHYRHLL